MNNKTFFSSISNYNKELFHSGAITWILNHFPEFQNVVLKSILGQDESKKATFVKALSEIRQIDVLIIYKLDEKYKLIHIENKIKASESTKKNKKEYIASKEEKLSQTEYYFSRLASEKFRKDLAREINKYLINGVDPILFSQENLKVDIDSENWNFIFLKPSHTLKEESKMKELNSWREDIWKVGKVKNPWVTKSYQELVFDSLTHLKKPSDSVKEYISFIKDEFSSSKNNLGNVDFLNFCNVDLAVKHKLNAVEKSTLEEWFIKLEGALIETYQNTSLDYKNSPLANLDFEVKFVTDTGNNCSFLIEASFIIPEFQFPKSKGVNIIKGRIGLQYEHNLKSAKMKFFFAAHDYHNVIIPHKTIRQGYNQKVEGFLIQENFRNLKNELKWDDKFNGSKGKSFCSRAKNIHKYKDYNELLNYFKKNLQALKIDLLAIDEKILKQFLS